MVIKSTPGFLHAIIIGAVVANSKVEVSDHASSGGGNVQITLKAPTVGTYLVDAMFTIGICADLTLQTDVTFVWR